MDNLCLGNIIPPSMRDARFLDDVPRLNSSSSREIPAAPFRDQATTKVLFVSNPQPASDPTAEEARRETLQELRTAAANLGPNWQVERIATGQVEPSLKNARKGDHVFLIHDAGTPSRSLGEQRAGLQGVANGLRFSGRNKCEGRTAFVTTEVDLTNGPIVTEDFVQQVEVGAATVDDLTRPEETRVLQPIFSTGMNGRGRISLSNFPLQQIRKQASQVLEAFSRLLAS